MKYLIIFSISLLSIFGNLGCDNKPVKAKKPVAKLDSLLNAIVSKYPKYKVNELVYNEMQNDILTNVPKYLKQDDYIDDFFLYVHNVEKNNNGSGYKIHFYTVNTIKDININYDLIYMTQNDTLAKSIDKTQKYLLPKCNKIELLTEKQVKLINKGNSVLGHHMPNLSVWKNINSLDVNLGYILCLD